MEHRIYKKYKSNKFSSDFRDFATSLDLKLDILISNLLKTQIG